MITKKIFVPRFASWAPGIQKDEWLEWAQGEREIERSAAAPGLDLEESPHLRLGAREFALFKRRLSQISKMTIQVLHDCMPLGEGVKVMFLSFRGEIGRQFQINRMMIEEGGVSPAAFSHSVFNTPPALASIALGLRAGYSAIYPGNGSFADGLLAAAAPLLSGDAEEIAMVYADELCPPEYGMTQPPLPLAFAALLSTQEPGIPLSLAPTPPPSPEAFLRQLICTYEPFIK